MHAVPLVGAPSRMRVVRLRCRSRQGVRETIPTLQRARAARDPALGLSPTLGNWPQSPPFSWRATAPNQDLLFLKVTLKCPHVHLRAIFCILYWINEFL